jgi:hypothetical protein
MRYLHNVGEMQGCRGRAGGKAWPLAASRGKSLPLETRFTDLPAGTTLNALIKEIVCRQSQV